MPDSTQQSASKPVRHIPLAEFVALTAMLMASNALAIDIMLPALPDMGATFGIPPERQNDQQLIIGAYTLGFSISQLFYGPLTDRFGRRSVLYVSLGLYSLFGLACVFAPDFSLIIAARFLQGASAGGSRVIAVSAARDLYAGRRMAKVMSMVMIVFMAAPILAPSFGQALLHVTDWRGIFWFLVLFGLLLILWVMARLPETLAPALRQPLNVPNIARNYWKVVTTRDALGYMVASGFLFSGLMSYVFSSEQIYRGVYDTGEMFGLWFAGAAVAMALANLVNSTLVEKLGMRRLSHAALVGMTVISAVHAFLALQGPVPFPVFYTLLILSFFTIGFQGPNYNAIAMEPLGRLAGSGAAVIGFGSTMISTLIGLFIASQFKGSITPIFVGHFIVCMLALVTILITERGKLMQSQNPPPPPP